MLLSKKISNGKGYARKDDYEYEGVQYEADIKNGDIVTIMNSGVTVDNKFGDESTEFVIKTRNGEKNYGINQTSINVLVDEFGKDTANWVGKDVKVLTKKGTFAGKKGIASYLVTNDYILDDFGEVVKANSAPASVVDEPDFDPTV